MKVVPRSDYPVRVRRRGWEEDPTVAELYEGIFDVTLNSVVDVVFVPDVSAIAPPFNDSMLPWDLDQITTREQARLAAAVFGQYVITPNATRSGNQEEFVRAVDRPARNVGIVFYVSPAKFSQYSADLESLCQSLGGLYPDGTVADIRGHPVIDFLEGTVLRSTTLRSEDAEVLGISQKW